MRTTPPEVRHVLVVRPEALAAHARIFVEEIGRGRKEQPRALRIGGGETGAVTLVHLHLLALDSAFTLQTKGGPAMPHEGPAPLTSDVAAVAAWAEKLKRRRPRRRRLPDEREAEDCSNEAPVL